MISTRDRTFSIVFPNTALFMSLKKSFSNSFLQDALLDVLNCMYGRNQGFCLNSKILWIFVIFRPSSMYNCRFLPWQMYLVLFSNVGISFSVDTRPCKLSSVCLGFGCNIFHISLLIGDNSLSETFLRSGARG
ncbi:hypothetical protein CI610_03789 [invertebrate metagenome]|uniref:Uncharacterized protein n=1 Tax=invertebrate metagenome TaxID=1711999 RepID=A0A2H9T240_9ZZZZ